MAHPRRPVGRLAHAAHGRAPLVAFVILALLLGGAGALYAASTVSVTVRLASDDPAPEGSAAATVEVRLSDPIADGELRVQVRTLAGSAAAADFTPVDQVLTFVAGGPTALTVDVPIIQDTVDELNETFKVELVEVVGGNTSGDTLVVGDPVTVIIADDDSPDLVSVVAPAAPVLESSGGAGFTVNLSAASPQPVSIRWQLLGSGARQASIPPAAPADVTVASGTWVVPAGNASRTFSVGIVNDALIEADEQFTLDVTGAVNIANVDFAVQQDKQATITDDDPPTAVDDAFTVAEDAPAAALDVLANDVGGEAGALSIAAASDPANGVVAITGGGAGLTYQPDPNYCNSQVGGTADTFTYTLSPGGGSATVSVTVTCVNDGPVVDANGAAGGLDFAATYTEPNPPAPAPVALVDAGLTVADAEGDVISGVVVKILDTPVNAADLLAVNTGAVPGGTIAASYSAATGTLTLSGNESAANYQAVLRTLTFDHSSNNPGASRQIAITATDAAAQPASSTPPAVITLTIDEFDEPPALAVNAGLTVAEAATGVVGGTLLRADDNDTPKAELIFTLVAAPSNGLLRRNGVTLRAGNSFSQAELDSGQISYTHNGSNTANDGFGFTLSDGSTTLPVAIFTITVTPVNDAPVIQLTSGATAYTAGTPAVLIDSGATISDGDSADFNGGSLTVSVTGGQAGDLIAVRNEGAGAGQIGVSGATVSYGGQPIGTIAAGPPFRVTFAGAGATPAAAQALLRNITFASAASATGSRTAAFTLSDGDGGTSQPALKGISLDDAPVAVDDTATVAKDSPITPLPVLDNDSDPEGGPLTIIAVTQGANGAVAITGNGSGLAYQPAAGFTGTDSFTYTVRDIDGGTDTATVTVTVVGDPPPPPVFRAFLPLLAVAPPPTLPDLEISFAVTPAAPTAGAPASIAVMVTNRGAGPASNFWVDLYINPSARPTVNRPWNELCGLSPCFGMAWLYTGTLQPGQSVTLNSAAQSAANPNGFQTSFTDWRGYFANGTTRLYALADSWNRDNSGAARDPNGAVVESNEANNLAEQSISVAPGTLPAARGASSPASIPARPAFR